MHARIRLLLALILVLTVSIQVLPSGSASIVQEHWKAPTPTKNGQIGIFYDDRELYANSIGLYAGVSRDGKIYSESCASLTDPDCTSAVKFAYAALLPPCSIEYTTNCIVDVYLVDKSGTKRSGTFKKLVTEDPTFFWDGGGTSRVPYSRSESIWTVTSTTSSSPLELSVSAVVAGSYRPLKNDLFINRLSGTISPVVAIERVGRTRSLAISSEMSDRSALSDASNSYWNGGFNWQSPDDCVAVAKDLCYQRQPFPQDQKYGMTVRLARPVVGWVHGRFKAPEVNISNSATEQIIDVRGEAITVPVIGQYFDENQVSKEILAEYASVTGGTVGTPEGGTARRFQGFYPLDSIVPLNRLNKWLPYFNDQASATPSVWMFASVEYSGLEESLRKLGAGSKCVLDNPSISGIVATNATAYLGAVPEYDDKEGALNYKVAAPHFDTDRKEFLGTYDLVMDSKVARCIYNFTSAPIKASVEIVAGDNGGRVASTVLNEKDGWLTLGAYGFTFSTPTISVKLTQEKVAAPIVTPSPTPTQVASVKKESRQIICLKAGKTKKVTGVNPKCPKGFKKS